MEAQWATEVMPLRLFAWPDPSEGRNRFEIGIPKLGSLILIDRITNETVAFGVLDDAPAAPQLVVDNRDRLRRIEERLLGRAGSEKRQEKLTRLSWRLLSSLLPGI
eukprot:gene35213-biopygen22996